MRASGNVPLRLEHAAQVPGDDGQRCREEPFWYHHFGAAGAEVPALDEVAQHRLAVQTGTPAVERLVLSRPQALMAVCAWEHPVQVLSDPRELRVVDGHRLDSQRPVRSLVLTYETVGLQPTRECGLVVLTYVEDGFAIRVAPVPFELVPRPQRACLDELPGALAAASPNQVVS